MRHALLIIAAALAAAPAVHAVEQAIEDTATTGRVEAKFLANSQLNPFNINTTTEGGVVTLTGGVRTQEQKELAEELARAVPGVVDVRNNIIVVGTPFGEGARRGFRDRMRDAGVSASVRARVTGKGEFRGLRIGIETINGHVLLSGVVPTQEQKERIGQLAAETRGVQRVINNLTVSPKEPRDFVQNIGRQVSDEWVEKRVETAILMNRHLSIRKLGVEVDDHVVILTGFVDTGEQRTLAGELAASIQGVEQVRNEIALRPEGLTPPPSPDPPVLEPIDPPE